jgi:S-ribosylhomocysteine lyase LuxS involved in autoinducer biosynthesis
MRFRAPNPPTLGYTGSRPFEPLNLGVPRFVSVPATVSGLNHARPTDIERTALDIRFRAPNPPTLTFTGPRPLQHLVLALLRFVSVPATVSGWNHARPIDIERTALDIWFHAPNPPTLTFTSSRPLQPLVLALPRFVSVPVTVSGSNPARPTGIKRSALDIRFRAPNPPTLGYTGSRPFQPLNLGVPRFVPVPATVSGLNHARPTDIERTALDIRFHAPNPPTLTFTGPRPFQPLVLGLPRLVSVPAAISGWNHARPTDIERGALDIRFRAPNPPTLTFTAPGPSSPSFLLSPASYQSPLPSAGGITHVPPISSAMRSIFSFERQTRPPLGTQFLA